MSYRDIMLRIYSHSIAALLVIMLLFDRIKSRLYCGEWPEQTLCMDGVVVLKFHTKSFADVEFFDKKGQTKNVEGNR